MRSFFPRGCLPITSLFGLVRYWHGLVCTLTLNIEFRYFPGWLGGGAGGCVGWEESIIRLISAEAEAEALLGLAELGKN